MSNFLSGLFGGRPRIKPITKLTLFRKAMELFYVTGPGKFFTANDIGSYYTSKILSMAVGGVYYIICVVVFTTFSDGPIRSIEWVIFTVITIALTYLTFSIVITPFVLRGIFLIAKQEKHFGFNFNREMKAEGICGTEHISKDWFINASGEGVIAFRRGFITTIENVTNRYGGQITVTAICANGQSIHVTGIRETIKKLIEWVKENE